MRKHGFIRIDTESWQRNNSIPEEYRSFFICLACNMGNIDLYDFDADCFDTRQAVIMDRGLAERLCGEMGWPGMARLRKGIRALCDCGAIRRAATGVYEVSKRYASLGARKTRKRKVADQDERSESPDD